MKWSVCSEEEVAEEGAILVADLHDTRMQQLNVEDADSALESKMEVLLSVWAVCTPLHLLLSFHLCIPHFFCIPGLTAVTLLPASSSLHLYSISLPPTLTVFWNVPITVLM